jgi:hypothetical protein
MRNALLTTILFSLSVALAPRVAAADEGPPDSLTLLGTTYGFSWAPADASCDVRFGDHPNAKRIFGVTMCTGEVPAGIHCDIGPFGGEEKAMTAAQPATPPGVAIPMFGKVFCFGDVPPPTRCDVVVGEKPTEVEGASEDRM